MIIARQNRTALLNSQKKSGKISFRVCVFSKFFWSPEKVEKFWSRISSKLRHSPCKREGNSHVKVRISGKKWQNSNFCILCSYSGFPRPNIISCCKVYWFPSRWRWTCVSHQYIAASNRFRRLTSQSLLISQVLYQRSVILLVSFTHRVALFFPPENLQTFLLVNPWKIPLPQCQLSICIKAEIRKLIGRMKGQASEWCPNSPNLFQIVTSVHQKSQILNEPNSRYVFLGLWLPCIAHTFLKQPQKILEQSDCGKRFWAVCALPECDCASNHEV